MTRSEESPPEAVTVVIRHPDGRYLLIKRGPLVSAPGYWAPVSGKLEEGESLAQAARREALEEVALIVDVGAEVYRCPSHNHRWTLVWLEAVAGNPDGLQIHPDEVEDADWLTAREAAALEPMFDATRAFFLRRAVEEER